MEGDINGVKLLRLQQNGLHLTGHILKWMLLNNSVWISITLNWKLFLGFNFQKDTIISGNGFAPYMVQAINNHGHVNRALLLTCFNINPSIDKSQHPL